MKNKILCFAMSLVLAASYSIDADEHPMAHLKHIADGLNIEGGIIPQCYLHKEQIWSNLCVVLDRPFEDGMEWKELTKLNSFPLKEASILDYNEAQVNFAFVNVMLYYIQNAHQIADITASQTAKILIQIHRNTSGLKHLELLEQLLQKCYPGVFQKRDLQGSRYEWLTCFFPDLNVEVCLCYGTDPENLGNLNKYRQYHMVLSLSLVAGLHPDWKSGSLLIPQEFIPFSLSEAAVSFEEKYTVQNHLLKVIPEIIHAQKDAILTLINENFRSLNPDKWELSAKKMNLADFKESILLQVDGLFNPSQLPPNYKS